MGKGRQLIEYKKLVQVKTGMNRNIKKILHLLTIAGLIWFVFIITLIQSTSEDERPKELRRPRDVLEQFKPVQPSPKFDFPQIPIVQKPIERVIGFFQQQEPDRNIIPPPLHHQLMKATPPPNGPGENGKPVNVERDKLSLEERVLYEQGLQKHAYNEFASNMIPVNRSLLDARDEECKALKYATKLPDTSVIICFHNEAWTVLLRSVHSVIDRSDSKLLKEIILVDDFSDQSHLGDRLKEYMDKLRIVKIVRLKQREGLIRARLAGAREATGSVLTFLDSHIECTKGWLEPLLDEISRNDSTVVTPVIDNIDDNTLQYQYGSAKDTSVGGFGWNLLFNWHALPDREKKRRSSQVAPIYSPTMAGGLFSISKRYFEYLGTYDAGMDIWGGENLEISFRIWMCGGTLEIIPCSHVGHIFRKRSPYKWKEGEDVVRKNTVRLAEVWMDDYKKYYYERINNDLGYYGDISSRTELRKRLNCKSFDWYLKNVYPELLIPANAAYVGEIRNMAVRYCLDSPANHLSYNKPVDTWPCHNQGGNQYWLMSNAGEIRRDEACIDYTGSGTINMYVCHGQGGNQRWNYHVNGLIEHIRSNRCMEISFDGRQLSMANCDPSNQRQQWKWMKGGNFSEVGQPS